MSMLRPRNLRRNRTDVERMMCNPPWLDSDAAPARLTELLRHDLLGCRPLDRRTNNVGNDGGALLQPTLSA